MTFVNQTSSSGMPELDRGRRTMSSVYSRANALSFIFFFTAVTYHLVDAFFVAGRALLR